MPGFESFVLFAEMRTGSNFLEANLNAFEGITCHGEAFNPHFIGYPNSTDVLGIGKAARDANPMALVEAVRNAPGLNGFRFFNDHDGRILDPILDDTRCAKVVLTRNPVDSYVSWKIAQATGQWKLTNAKHAKSGTVVFDAAEFEAHMAALQAFQVRILNHLQRSGQTAFFVAYEDLQDVAVMNGLAAWLGCSDRLESLDKSLKKQNPQPMSEKVANFDEMERALARLDRFNLNRTPNFEPRRGPAVPTFVAAAQSPLLYMPVRSGPEDAVLRWLAAVDGADPEALQTSFTQKTLRQWKRQHTGHRSFTVLRHPVRRAHAAFCDRILQTGPGSYTEIRASLLRDFKVPLPRNFPDDSYGVDEHRAAFLGFLGFLKANLAGQTAIRVDATWASQSSILEGFAGFASPDMILREDRLTDDLPSLCAQAGLDPVPFEGPTDPHDARLAQILDAQVEDAVRDVFQRDYMMFGFDRMA